MNAVRMVNGCYSVDSLTGAERSYRVDPVKGTCSCPHFVARLVGTGRDCKHLTMVRESLASQVPEGSTPLVITPETEADRKLEREMLELFGPSMWHTMLNDWTEDERQRAIHTARSRRNRPTALQAAQEKAVALTTAELYRYAEQYRGEVAGAACLLTLAARKLQEQPKREAPAGVECFLQGATEAEKARALAVYR